MSPARDGESLLPRMAVIGARELPRGRIVDLEERPATIGVGRGMRLGLVLGVVLCHVALARETVIDNCARLKNLQAVATSASVRSAS